VKIQSHYFPIRHPDSQNFDPDQVLQWLRDHIAAGICFVTQNGLYDWGWLRADAGIVMPPSDQLEEIGALATIVDENRYRYSLDALCTWRGLPGKDETLLKEGGATLGFPKKAKPATLIWQLPARFVGPYAEADAANTLALFKNLNPILDQENTRAAYRLEVDLLPMVHEMRQRGIRIDTAAAERARDLLLRKRDAVFAELSEKLGANVGMAEIGRTAWLAETFDQQGIKYPRTEKGNPSFTAGTNGWMHRHPHWLPQLIVKADKYNNAAVNFLEAYILKHVMNGRVHAEIHPHRSDEGGTRSLRFSYSSPPLQLMPAHDEELAPLIRGVFLPEEGEWWAKPDISQQEFRFIVHYAARHKLRGAQEAVERYRNDPNTDFHAHVSSMTGRDRQISKATNFAKAFGAGVRKFAAMIGRPVSEAEAIYDQYDRELPFVSQLSILCERAVRRNGYLTLYDGARRHWTDWAPGGKWQKGLGPCPRQEAEQRVQNPDHPWYRKQLWLTDTRKAMNALIQGSAARHTKLWMRACWRAGIVPLLQMHDALDCSVSSPKQAELVAQLGREAVKLEVPMQVDLAYGRNWGDAKHTWEERNAAPNSTTTDADTKAPQDDLPWDDDEEIADEEIDDKPKSQSAYQVNWGEALERDFPHASSVFTAAASIEHDPPPQTEAPPPRSGNGRFSGNGSGAFEHTGSKTEAEHDTYAEEHAGEPFNDAYLYRKGYQLAHVFDYTLADGTLLYQQNRYELKNGITPTKKNPRKRFLAHRNVYGTYIFGAGDRRVVYNWPAIMRAGPGSTVFVTEGENKAKILIDAGLLATTVLSHKWTPECVAALTGQHLVILTDHDKDGDKLGADAQRKLTPVAASTRIVPARHLWKHLPGEPEPESGDDVWNWIVEHKGDPAKLIEICREIPADGIITAEPYQFRAEADIAPWQWLYGRHLLRGEVSGTAAMGGTGKSTLSIVEALAMASGCTLLGETSSSPTPLRVVLINLEDTRNTMDKRIAAVMHHYDLTPADIGDRLIVKVKGDIKIKVARQLRSGDVERNEPIIRALTKLMLDHRADVLSIDSFIRTHRVNENDNSAVQEVVECFEDIATETQCAMHLWHHTRKAGGEKATIETTRGAIAFVDACRSARILETMSANEHAELMEVQPDMLPAGFYFRAFNGKRNFAPPASQSEWFKLESVILLNGDDVGVATAWQYPASFADLSTEVTNSILDDIDTGLPNGQRYSNHNSAKERAAWPVVQQHCPNKTRSQCRQVIATWMGNGTLFEDDYDDPVQRKPAKGLYVRAKRQPGKQEAVE
jgi:DNA polymerase I-like protein with 3'-5' exonuclease and polymerase domains